MIESRPIHEKLLIVRTLFDFDFRCYPKVAERLRERGVRVTVGGLRTYAERLRNRLERNDPIAKQLLDKALEGLNNAG